MYFKLELNNVCAKTVEFSMDDNFIVSDVSFKGGCPGNAIGVASLSVGRHADELIKILEGVGCGKNTTSCPDQFSKALVKAKEQIKSQIPEIK